MAIDPKDTPQPMRDDRSDPDRLPRSKPHLSSFSEVVTIFHGDGGEDRYHDVLKVRCGCGDVIIIGKASLGYEGAGSAHGKWLIIDPESYEQTPVNITTITGAKEPLVDG